MNIRKIFIPLAAGCLVSPALMAANAEGPTVSWFVSDEYLSTSPSTENLSHQVVGFTIEAEYAVGDIINLTFSGNALDDSTLPSSIVSAGSPAVVTVGLLSSSSGAATYRVTEVNTGGGNSTVNATFALCTIAAPCEFNADAVDLANGVVMGFSAQTGTGLALDTGGGADRSTALWVTGSQFAAAVTTAFDGIVDVEDNRESFTLGTTDNATFVVEPFAQSCVGPTDPCEGIWLTANPVDQDVTIAANFGWVADTVPATPALDPAAGVFALPNCSSPAFSATAITATCNYNASDVFIDVGLNSPANPAVLPATSFVSTHVLNFLGSGGTANSITVVNIGLGEWTLNGFSSEISYTPFGTGIGQVIYLANRGPQTGAITVEWIDQNGNSGSFDIGNIAAGSTLSIGPLINAGLPAAQRASGRLALTVIANIPACDAQINAQYNVSGDRAFSVSRDNCT